MSFSGYMGIRVCLSWISAPRVSPATRKRTRLPSLLLRNRGWRQHFFSWAKVEECGDEFDTKDGMILSKEIWFIDPSMEVRDIFQSEIKSLLHHHPMMISPCINIKIWIWANCARSMANEVPLTNWCFNADVSVYFGRSIFRSPPAWSILEI